MFLSLTSAFEQVFSRPSTIEEFTKLLGSTAPIPKFQRTQNSGNYLNLHNVREGAAYQSVTGFIEQYPGCCGMCIIHDAENYGPATTASSVYQRFFERCLEVADLAGYTIVQYTTVASQTHKIEALTALGFRELSKFTSQRTDHEITIWQKQIA